MRIRFPLGKILQWLFFYVKKFVEHINDGNLQFQPDAYLGKKAENHEKGHIWGYMQPELRYGAHNYLFGFYIKLKEIQFK